jgi:hypothetical protein
LGWRLVVWNNKWVTHPQTPERFKCELQNENVERKSYGTLPPSQHFKDKKGVLKLRDGD